MNKLLQINITLIVTFLIVLFGVTSCQNKSSKDKRTIQKSNKNIYSYEKWDRDTYLNIENDIRLSKASDRDRKDNLRLLNTIDLNLLRSYTEDIIKNTKQLNGDMSISTIKEHLNEDIKKNKEEIISDVANVDIQAIEKMLNIYDRLANGIREIQYRLENNKYSQKKHTYFTNFFDKVQSYDYFKENIYFIKEIGKARKLLNQHNNIDQTFIKIFKIQPDLKSYIVNADKIKDNEKTLKQNYFYQTSLKYLKFEVEDLSGFINNFSGSEEEILNIPPKINTLNGYENYFSKEDKKLHRFVRHRISCLFQMQLKYELSQMSVYLSSINVQEALIDEYILKLRNFLNNEYITINDKAQLTDLISKLQDKQQSLNDNLIIK